MGCGSSPRWAYSRRRCKRVLVGQDGDRDREGGGTPPGVPLVFRPEFGRGYPLNLSISLSGGKETNKDSLSNGE